MYKFSATQWIFGKEPIETSFERLKRYGYDGVELAGEPGLLDAEEIKRLLKKYELACTSICGIYTKERDLASANPEVRRRAVQYVKDNVDLAVRTGASVVIVVPTPVGKSGPDTTAHEEWALAVESLKEAGTYAEKKGVLLAIEALNRFETYLVNTLENAKKLAEQVNVASVRVMADLFHMNIEERNNSDAIRNAASYIVHVHIADNTREAAGYGQTDFREVMATLSEVGYEGAITMEFMPRVSNPYLSAQQNASGTLYDDYTEQSIRHMKEIISSLGGKL